MKLAAFSDLHSNSYALEAMLAAGTDVDQWVSLGDCVGLLPGVNAVLDLIRARRILAISGNHESALLSGMSLPHSVTGTDAIERQRATISDANREFVAGLPETLHWECGGRTVRAVHTLDAATDRDAKYRVDLAILSEQFRGADIVLFGDTHLPLLCHCRDFLLVNPGSCGFPIDVTRRGSFAVIETDDLSCELRRVDYDVAPLLDDLNQAGYDVRLREFMRTGTWGR